MGSAGLKVRLGKLPQHQTVRVLGAISLEALKMRRPIRRLEPLTLWQKERLRKNATADDKVSPLIGHNLPVADNSRSHLRQGRRPIRLAERLPSQRAR